MSKKKRQPTPKFLIQAALVYYEIKASGGKTSYDVRQQINHDILTQLYGNKAIRSKVDGMCYRNYIPEDVGLTDDVIQTAFLYLSKYNKEEIFIMSCENFKRLIALFTTIAKSEGFRKMKKDISPNQSLAKQILFTSNFNKSNNIDTHQGTLEYNNGYSQSLNIFEEIPELENTDLWMEIKKSLSDDDKGFLEFLLMNIYNKKRIIYSKTHRENFMSLNEYKINFQILKSRIREIVKNNGLEI